MIFISPLFIPYLCLGFIWISVFCKRDNLVDFFFRGLTSMSLLHVQRRLRSIIGHVYIHVDIVKKKLHLIYLDCSCDINTPGWLVRGFCNAVDYYYLQSWPIFIRDTYCNSHLMHGDIITSTIYLYVLLPDAYGFILKYTNIYTFLF